MKICIDLTALSYHITGIERYALCVTQRMIEIDQDNKYVLVFRNEIYPAFSDKVDNNRITAIILHGENKLLFIQITLCNCLKKIDADKYIFFAFTSPYFFRKRGIINTIHDMGAWDASFAMKWAQKLYWRVTIKNSAKHSEKIITVSNFSKDRINKILNISKEKIHVIYSALSDSFMNNEVADYSNVKSKYHLPNKYIVSLSTIEPRKNFKLLLDSFMRIKDKVDYDLVLIGRKGWNVDDLLRNYKDVSRVHFTGFVEDLEVKAIYRNALCFVFPSYYEGFGLPPIEALSCGTPVLSSDAASLPEILMKQAEYFNNNDGDDLQKHLLELEDRIETFPRGLNDFQSQNYSFSVSAKKLLKLLD